MSKGKGFDRLRLLAVVAGAASLFGGHSRSARAGTPSTVVAGGATWRFENSGAGPGTVPFTGCTKTTTKGIGRDVKAGPRGTGSACAMSLREGSIGQQGDAFDGMFLLAINGNQYQDPDGVFTVANTIPGVFVTGSPASVSGLDVSAEYYFPGNIPVARAVYSMSNPTGVPVSVLVQLGHNVGSDGATRVEATSDGDLTVETVDGWHVTSDLGGGTGTNGAPDPVVTLARFGPGAASPVASSLVVFGAGEEDQIDNYNVTIPANSTRRIMVFARISPDPQTAIAAAPTFDSTTTLAGAGLLVGLSPSQQQEIVNWAPAGTGISFVANVPTIGEFAKWMLLLGVGGLGVYAMRRRRPRA